MKKSLFLLAFLSAVLTACSKNNDVKDPSVSKLEVVLDVQSISADVLNYFSVEYTYVDFTGKTVTKAITKPEKISFSIDNPTLGEDPSTPFTVQLLCNLNNSASEKTSGTYDSSFVWQLDVNAYDQKGKLITDSGKVQYFSSNVVYQNDKFSAFKQFTSSQAKMDTITYYVFFCKTISGEWHIGVNGVPNTTYIKPPLK